MRDEQSLKAQGTKWLNRIQVASSSTTLVGATGHCHQQNKNFKPLQTFYREYPPCVLLGPHPQSLQSHLIQLATPSSQLQYLDRNPLASKKCTGDPETLSHHTTPSVFPICRHYQIIISSHKHAWETDLETPITTAVTSTHTDTRQADHSNTIDLALEQLAMSPSPARLSSQRTFRIYSTELQPAQDCMDDLQESRVTLHPINASRQVSK